MTSFIPGIVIILLFLVIFGLALSTIPSFSSNLLSFDELILDNPAYVMVFSDALEGNSFISKFNNTIYSAIKNETKKNPLYTRFHNISEMNEQLINSSFNYPLHNILGFHFQDTLNESFIPVTIIYNKTMAYSDTLSLAFKNFNKALMDAFVGFNINFTSFSISDLEIALGIIFTLFGMMYLVFALVLPVYPISFDTENPRKEYMLSYGLKISSYWIGNFIFDLIFVILALGLLLLLSFISGYKIVKDQFKYLFGGGILMAAGSNFFTYVSSFIFKKATNNSLFLLAVRLILGMATFFIVQYIKSDIKHYILAWEPLSCFTTISFLLSLNLNENKVFRNLMIFQGCDVVLWGTVLFLIEKLRVTISDQGAKRDFSVHVNLFRRKKDNQKITSEVLQMEESLSSDITSDYAIKILHAYHLFYDSQNNPNPAVNDVTLGVKRGDIFGFLGANGAGKTTMINMIAKNLPLSSGEIYVDGTNINETDAHLTSICPQMNTHLINCISLSDTIYFFGHIVGYTDEKIKSIIDQYFPILDLEEHKDKRISELSGGNARKVAVLIAIMSPCHLIILDEPTSSIDPLSRMKIHQIIRTLKGQKTFMICTHLLDEAEEMCDNISMMINGCIYAIGSPQYLSDKFGAEWTIDVIISEENKLPDVNSRMIQELPNCTMKIRRDLSITYTMPSENHTATQLFTKMKSLQSSNIGIKHFSCSPSTLDSVFIELIKRSGVREEYNEQDDNSPDLAL